METITVERLISRHIDHMREAMYRIGSVNEIAMELEDHLISGATPTIVIGPDGVVLGHRYLAAMYQFIIGNYVHVDGPYSYKSIHDLTAKELSCMLDTQVSIVNVDNNARGLIDFILEADSQLS